MLEGAWDWIYAIKMFGVDVRIVSLLFGSWIVLYIGELIIEIVDISYAVFVISAVPDFSAGLLSCCEGVSAFDVLDAF